MARHTTCSDWILSWSSFLFSQLGQCLSREKTSWSRHPPFPAFPCALSGALFLEWELQTTKAAAVNVSVWGIWRITPGAGIAQYVEELDQELRPWPAPHTVHPRTWSHGLRYRNLVKQWVLCFRVRGQEVNGMSSPFTVWLSESYKKKT